MKRTPATLLLTLLLLASARLGAQTTVVVANGTASQSHLPLYAYNAKYAQWTQSIYPSSELTELQGQTLTAFTYHTSASTFIPEVGTWTLKLAITTKSNLNYSKDNTAATEVFSGAPTFADGDLTFTFDTPFEYTGGNLLVWFDH